LISLDALRTRTPEQRARQTGLHHQIDVLDSQPADREVYLNRRQPRRLPHRLRSKAATATIAKRQRVLRLLVKDVLVGPGPEVRGPSWARRLHPTARVTR
jgi:site-specific DNA recombinase